MSQFMEPADLVRKSSSALSLLRERNKETGKMSINPWLLLQTRAETTAGGEQGGSPQNRVKGWWSEGGIIAIKITSQFWIPQSFLLPTKTLTEYLYVIHVLIIDFFFFALSHLHIKSTLSLHFFGVLFCFFFFFLLGSVAFLPFSSFSLVKSQGDIWEWHVLSK